MFGSKIVKAGQRFEEFSTEGLNLGRGMVQAVDNETMLLVEDNNPIWYVVGRNWWYSIKGFVVSPIPRK